MTERLVTTGISQFEPELDCNQVIAEFNNLKTKLRGRIKQFQSHVTIVTGYTIKELLWFGL
jgi:hypothetical protein